LNSVFIIIRFEINIEIGGKATLFRLQAFFIRRLQRIKSKIMISTVVYVYHIIYSIDYTI